MRTFPSLLEPRRRVNRARTSARKVDDLVRALGVVDADLEVEGCEDLSQLDEEVAGFRDWALDQSSS